MKLSKEAVFRRAVRSAFTAGATCSVASLSLGSALAQEAPAAAEGATQLDTIEVTGTRIRRVDFETASPVFVIDRSAIETSGVVTLGQLLQELPTIAGAATNPQVNNGGGTGAATVSLRGLGSERTLVLLNGRRLVDSPATDINAIPINLIERVEILKDGASAIYGSDAVGGVVNFITRKSYQGAEFIAGYGISDRGDAALTNYWTTFGTSTQRGGLVFGVNFDDRQPVISADRDFSKDPFALYYGQQISVGSSRSFPGRYVVSAATANTIPGLDCDGDGTPQNHTANTVLTRIATEDGRQVSDYRCFIAGGAGNDTYDFQDVNVVVTPQERYGSFLQGDYKLADSVSFFAEATYHKTSANFVIAPEPFDGRPSQANVPASAQSIYNPFGQDITDLRLRLVPVGNREERFDTDRFQTTLGLKGDVLGLPIPVLNNFRWDAYATFGKLQQTSEAHGEIYTPALKDALGPSFIAADGTPTCGTPSAPISGCVPVDFFGIPDGAALATIAPFVHDRTDQDMTAYAGSVSGDLLQLPAGPLGIAFGAEYREDSLDFKPDFLRQSALISGNSSSPISGEFDLKEVYVEFGIPILADLPAAKSLRFSLGARRSDYSTFGATTNGKYGLEYKPIDDLLLRATYADVFRAPTIVDLFSGQFESADTFTDPCNNFPVAQTGSAAFQRTCQFVPTTDANGDGFIDYFQTDTQLNAIVGGNPTLLPEEGDTLTLGFVYDPSWYDPLSVTVDFWKYHLDNTIGPVGSDNRLTQCFTNGLFCDSIQRDPASGEIFLVNDATDNIGILDTTGVDMGTKFNFGETGFGRVTYSLDLTYLIKYDNEQLAGDPATLLRSAGTFVDTSAGGNGHFARWRGLTNLSWKRADWTVNWAGRYIHHVTETAFDGGFAVDVKRKIDAQFITDLTVAYFLKPFNTEFVLGVDNFTDELAPLIYSGFNGTTDVRTYDGIGRFYWARLKYTIQ